MDTTANRLRKAMEIRNMKAVELHEKTGIGKSSISQYMNGTVNPKQDRIYLMAKALNVDELWLMGHDVPMNRINRNAPADDAPQGYYHDPETAAYANELKDNMKILFDAARNAKPSDLKVAADLLESLRKRESYD